MTPESKNVCQLSVGDIISNLPRDAIDNILTCLPLRDAVRTCVLSRRWRYMWANLPYLVLDQEMFATEHIEDMPVVTIYQVLLLKRVPILKFVLSLPGLKISHHIDLLVSFVTRNRGLQVLELHLCEGEYWYKLPASLFSCLELTRLSLQLCVIEPPTQFKGFNRLVSLEMYHCSILPDVLSGLISSCPLLEQLTVESHTPVKGHIQISAPNLRELNFTGQFTCISFNYTPRLSSCVLWLPEGLLPTGETSNVSQSLHNLIAVEHLYIDYYYAGYKLLVENRNSLPRKLTTTLNHLKSLTVRRISLQRLYEVSLVLCLMRSTSNLTNLAVLDVSEPWVKPSEYWKKSKGEDLERKSKDIRVCWKPGTIVDLQRISKLLEVQEWSEISLNRLRKVEVDQITGRASELAFIELLLAISPKLETMIVTPHASMLLSTGFEILKKMTRLRRLSPLAEIIYKY